MKKDENSLLDIVGEKLGTKNDRHLARALGVDQPVISKIRHGRLAVSAPMVVRIYDATDMPVSEIKSFITRGAQSRSVGKHPALSAPYGQQVAK